MYRIKILTVLTTLTISLAQADNIDTLIYNLPNCPYSTIAHKDIPTLISKYAPGIRTLDYGCGTGVSTKYLFNQGLEVIGVDKNKELIAQASINCPEISFYPVEEDVLPIPSLMCDIVFSNLVLFQLDSEEAVLIYLDEAYRVLAPDGVFIAVTGVEHMNNGNSFLRNSETNNLLADIEFTPFFRTEETYRRLFEQSGLEIIEMQHENTPFAILIAKKKT